MANTTNLDLVKPAGTDYALISMINENMEKIDAFAGSTNQAIAQLATTENLGTSFTTLASFESALDTYCGSMTDYTSKNIYACFTTASSPFSNTYYLGTVQKIVSNRYQTVLCQTNSENVIYGYRTNDGWTWDFLAKKSEVENKLSFVACGNVSSTSPMTITTSNNGRYIVALISASGRTGLYSVMVNSSGTITVVDLVAASSITVASNGTNKLKITSTSTSSASTYIVIFNGTASV